jgi:preprotein translocase subunit SecD
MNTRIKFWLIIVLVVVCILIVFPKVNYPITVPGVGTLNAEQYTGRFPLKLGLDLQGGIQLVFQADLSEIDNSAKQQAFDSVISVIEKRVNLFGVSESVVQSSKNGDNWRVIVELPGIRDSAAAANLVGRTAQLKFREASAAALLNPEATISAEAAFPVVTDLTGADLKSAQVTYGAGGAGDTGPQVTLQFSDVGARKFAEITRQNIGKQLAIFLDDQIITAPTVQQEIIGGNAVINGGFSVDEAKELAVQLNAGALPVPVSLISSQNISATLGQESVEKSIIASIVGLFSVCVFMVLFYGRLGLLADLALIIYTLISLAIFNTGLFILPPVTMTLSGIAGFVLSIGMAVDANILIFERMKEEERWV